MSEESAKVGSSEEAPGPGPATPSAVEEAQSRPEGEVVVEVEAPGADALAAEAESLRVQLELSQRLARGTMEKLREEHERTLRAAADLDNYRKRAAKEKEEIQKFAAERLVKDLVPVVDNLERALAAAPEGDQLSGGVRMVLKQIEGVLARHGVEARSALGQPFDPRMHEALMKVESQESAPGTVVAEHGRAWLLQGRLIRPAMVAVAAAPGSAPAPTATSGPDGGAGGAGGGAAS
jgi:molecular chaperone GrpE